MVPIGRRPRLGSANPQTVAEAHATLQRGIAFVRRQGGGAGGANLVGDGVRVRLIANQLRELDRFLGLLTEAVAGNITDFSCTRSAFARRRNTAAKLREVRAAIGLACMDGERLRAIGRLRDCLHHCGGHIHGEPAWRRLAADDACGPGLSREGGAGPDEAPQRLVLTDAALGKICTIYEDIGKTLRHEIRDATSNH